MAQQLVPQRVTIPPGPLHLEGVMLSALVAWTALVLIGFVVMVGPSNPAMEYVILDYIAYAVVIWLIGLVVIAGLVAWWERRARSS
jgi:hypothetical protein